VGINHRHRWWVIVSLAVWCVVGVIGAAPRESPDKSSTQDATLTDNRQLRLTGLHNAGDLYMPFSGPAFGDWSTDPETEECIHYVKYPTNSRNIYCYIGALWVGGVVSDDTLVSEAYDEKYGFCELAAADSLQGGILRVGNIADDEFLSETIGRSTEHASGVLKIGVTAHSYTWADTLYDNFAIIQYAIHNRNDLPINDGWIGFFLDNDVHFDSTESAGRDDYSGMLDTLLYDDDPSSRVLIPFTIDNDGDPVNGTWDSIAVRGAISIRLLDADFTINRENFNWWVHFYYDWYTVEHFGPRRLGTPEDPLRPFGDTSTFGIATTDEMQYYLLSHPEVDYDAWEFAIHDSADGWLPAPPLDSDYFFGPDTRFLYSFGPFDLAPGDSLSFTIAVVLADNIHQEPTDYAAYFDPQNPSLWRNRLDFGPLMEQHRRVDSVYKSNLILPNPGPPQGLIITDFEESYAKLSWWPSCRPDLAGYHLYTKSPTGQWVLALPDLLTDTTAVFSVPDPARTYEFAVGLIDTLGRQSMQSMPVSVVPGRPYPVESLTVHMDGATPELSWTTRDDTTLQAFMIYRSIWRGSYGLYDSTVTRRYRDVGAESGVQYHYKVTAMTPGGLESEPAGPVTAIPRARDQGVMFYSLNYPGLPNGGPFQNQYLTALYQSAVDIYPIGWHNHAEGMIGLKQMSHYSLMVIDWEKREDGLPLGLTDSLRYYLANGGKAVFILLATETITGGVKTYRYGDGSFFHDVLKLDSAVMNGFRIQNNSFVGDLAGCAPLTAEYPTLMADTIRFRPSMIPIIGYIPMAGYLYPTDEAEWIYTYVSSNPDSSDNGQCNGLRYLGEDYSFILLTFPLSLMKAPAAYGALKQALADMGCDMSCGDICFDNRVTIGDAVYLINYLYRDGPAPPEMHDADVDCSGAVDLGDVLALVNLLFRGGAGLTCRP